MCESVDCLQAFLITAEANGEDRAAVVTSQLSAFSEPDAQVAGAERADSPRPRPAAVTGEVEVRAEPKQRPVQTTDAIVAASDTVRVSTSKLESLMLQAEEFISVKLATGQRSTALRNLNSRLDTWKREWYQARISGDRDKIEEFLDWNATFMEGLVADIRMLTRSADDESRTIARWSTSYWTA